MKLIHEYFYRQGIIGIFWSILWITYYTNSPRHNQRISTEEKEYILANTHGQSSNSNKNNFHAPWKAILTSRACWALFIIHTCSNYGTYTFLTSIPKYMSEVLKFDIKSVSEIL
jgi:sugar phosphate permease